MADTKPLNRKKQTRQGESTRRFISRNPPGIHAENAGKKSARRWANKPLKVGTATDLDRRTMDKLRKGQLRPDARIDLHGLTASHAYTGTSVTSLQGTCVRPALCSGYHRQRIVPEKGAALFAENYQLGLTRPVTGLAY